PLQQLDKLRQYVPDAAAAHEAQDRGHSHVDVPPVEGERDELRDELRDHRKNDHLQPVRARGRDRLDWAAVYRLDELGVQLAHRSYRVQGESQHARERPDAHRGHEYGGHDQHLDRAEYVEYGTS